MCYYIQFLYFGLEDVIFTARPAIQAGINPPPSDTLLGSNFGQLGGDLF